MKKTLLSTLAIAAMLGAAHFAVAQTPPKSAVAPKSAAAPKSASAPESGKPMVTIAFSGYDELKGDLELIGKLGGNPNIAQGMEMMIGMMTQGEGLAAIDTKKPWGALVMSAPGQPQVLAFIPVTDMDKFVGLLEKFGMQPKDQGDGVYAIEAPGASITIKKSGGFALIATGAEALAAAPSDPLKALGGLEKKYDLAVKVSVANIPDAYKQMAIAYVKMGSEVGLRRMPGEDDDAFAARANVTKQSVQQIVDMISDTEQVLLGWSIDQKGKLAFLDVQISAVAGTKLAKQFATLVDTKTNFAGVNLPGAAITGNWVRTITDDEVVQAKGMLKQVSASMVKDLEKQDLDDAKRDLAKQLIGDLFGVFEKTIEGKKADGGMSVVLDPEAFKAVVAMNIVDGAKLEKALKALKPEIENEIPKAAVKLNAETYKGVRLHTISAPLPDDPDAAKAAKFLGDKAELVVGVSESALYLSAGRDAMKTLKAVVDGSKTPKTISPVAISVAVAPIVKFIAAAGEDNPQAQMVCGMLGGMLEKSAGKDHVTITVKGMPNGEIMHVELEEGILALIGGASQMAAGPGMAPGGMPPGMEMIEGDDGDTLPEGDDDAGL